MPEKRKSITGRFGKDLQNSDYGVRAKEAGYGKTCNSHPKDRKIAKQNALLMIYVIGFPRKVQHRVRLVTFAERIVRYVTKGVAYPVTR
jgi:hypothetical protein